jgi:hypothetical protein
MVTDNLRVKFSLTISFQDNADSINTFFFPLGSGYHDVNYDNNVKELKVIFLIH